MMSSESPRGAEGESPREPKIREKVPIHGPSSRRLSDLLGLVVSIDHRGEKGGTISIRYGTLEQLELLSHRLASVSGCSGARLTPPPTGRAQQSFPPSRDALARAWACAVLSVSRARPSLVQTNSGLPPHPRLPLVEEPFLLHRLIQHVFGARPERAVQSLDMVEWPG